MKLPSKNELKYYVFRGLFLIPIGYIGLNSIEIGPKVYKFSLISLGAVAIFSVVALFIKNKLKDWYAFPLMFLLMLYYLGKPLLDLPTYLQNDFESIQGYPQSYKEITGSKREKDYRELIIDDVKFKIPMRFLENYGDKYWEITYLPKSKFILHIEISYEK